MLLNDLLYYDAITNIIAMMANSHGMLLLPACALFPFPTPIMERGDLVVSASGLLSAQSTRPTPTKLILHFVLGHTYTRNHVLKKTR